MGLICVAFLVNAQEEKTIDLDEVTIQASSIIRKKDRQLIFPSKDQVQRSMDGLDLTRRMSLPRLWVDPNTKSISMENGNVQLRINGVLASSLEVAALSPEDIKRVEYHDNPGLWLLDLLRRAACGLPQAGGTSWQPYGKAVPDTALMPAALTAVPLVPPRPKRRRLGKALAVLLLLALAALAAGWYYTGGDLAALPQKLQSLGAESLPHAGARLI